MSYAEETRAPDSRFADEATPRRSPSARLALATLFLLTSFPLGMFWFVVLVTLLSVGLALTIVWVGLPILALAMLVCVLGSGSERWRLGALLGTRLPSSYRPLPRGLFARLRVRAMDPALWRALLYLLLLFPVGLAEFFVVLALLTSVTMVTYPLYFWILPAGSGVLWPGFAADTFPEALLVMIVGLVILTAVAATVLGVAWAHRHLGRFLLGPGSRERLEERVEVLTESRSKSVEATIVERRRIERDLHDGAQQRLVSLAMSLGIARQKLEKSSSGDPEATREQATELVGEAHEEAKRALAEVRNLIRGIHPAVLTDRGLDAAISALAGRSPVPTSVDVDLEERPSEAAEITAYFVIAEVLANVAKHSEATEARVRVRRERTVGAGFLVVEIEDDGKGGADPAGTGLGGLADRAATLDGRLIVESPTGGPTRVRAELPWGPAALHKKSGSDARCGR